MVLLAAIEFNREDAKDEKVIVEGKENKIHCADKKEEGKMTTKEENGANEPERNVEAAWTNKSKCTVGKEQTCRMSWYNIFRFMGKTKI